MDNTPHDDYLLLKKHNTKAFSHYTNHLDAIDYAGCEYIYNNQKFIQRTAKITPKKIGQFVTLWKRDPLGISTPYSIHDDFENVVIICKNDNLSGLFIFTRECLITHQILTSKKEGKRGFRVYPIWDKPASKQALQTQAWQKDYFHLGLSLGN